jgi:uncharacterized protein DUF5908
VTVAIEIKQLVVRAVVEPRRTPAPSAAAARREPSPAQPAARAGRPAEPEVDLDALAAACARQVLRELRKRRGR